MAKQVRTPVVRLRVAAGKSGIVATVGSTSPLQELAARWMYVLRNRSRWSNDEDQRTEIGKSARKDLARLGIRDKALRAVNNAHHVEVEIHHGPGQGPLTSEQHAAASFPWEFVLSAATTDAGRTDPLLVTRVLPRAGKAPKGKPSSFLFLESAPGRLSGYYSFESEYARLRAATQRQYRWRKWNNEPLDRVKRRLTTLNPQVIHVSGIDNHQAVQIVDDIYEGKSDRSGTAAPKAPPPIPDGMVVCGHRKPEEPVSSAELAAALVPPGTHPWLITFNLYYSSSRTAVECVRRGAFAALGFQDEVNDELAELFFQEFYRAWHWEPDGVDLPHAFEVTWKTLRRRSKDLYGTGIVLWLAQSAFGRRPLMVYTEDDEGEAAVVGLPTAAQRDEARQRPIHEVLQVEVKVPQAINYSLLHNGRPFIDKLTLNKLVEHTLDEVSVVVDMNVGDGSQPFRHTETLLDGSQLSLAEKVRLPLTAPLLRSLREGVQSTFYAKVMWDGRVAHESTASVMLLPVDEWLDDTEQNPWLPSFVLPRDPAVARVIAVARRHLVTLLDDTTAGFDGYQSVDDELEDPAEFVDLQVQAIWSALVHEFKLLYINPPPAYFERSQRLRTPSEVVGSNSGTCVDLALLLASCLEYIDVYPVIVLLTGHAFVGYWRNPTDHEEFARVAHVPASTPVEVGVLSRTTAISLVDKYGWRLASQQYQEVRQYLRRGKLRFLEATGLCFNFSFAEAIKEGAANMRDEVEFDSLLDIHLARSADPAVTPLPILSLIGDSGGAR
jgi:hypothetical protein